MGDIRHVSCNCYNYIRAREMSDYEYKCQDCGEEWRSDDYLEECQFCRSANLQMLYDEEYEREDENE